METPTYVALSRQSGLLKEMEVVANNVANSSTVGFRSEHTLFQEYLARTGAIGNRQNVSYTQDAGQYRTNTEGPLQSTSNQYDLALRGDGFFVVGDPAGNTYARTGEFHMDGNGNISSSEGFPLLLEGGQPLQIDSAAGPAVISDDGTVRQGQQTIGRIQIVRFGDEGSLQRANNGFYVTDQAPLPTTGTKVIQGALEGSNVIPVLEITRMLDISRQYDSTQRMLESENTRIQQTNQKLTQNV